MSVYLKIYPFEIKEGYNIFFVEDMHGMKVLADHKTFSFIPFDKMSADFLCGHLNSLGIDGLKVKVIGTPRRIVLVEGQSNINSISHVFPEYQVSSALHEQLMELCLERLLDYVLSGVHNIRLGLTSQVPIFVSFGNYDDGHLTVHYGNLSGKPFLKEGYRHLDYEGDEVKLVFSDGKLMYLGEYYKELP